MATAAVLKIVFDRILAADCPISVKFCTGKRDSTAIKRSHNINSKFHKLKIARAIMKIVISQRKLIWF